MVTNPNQTSKMMKRAQMRKSSLKSLGKRAEEAFERIFYVRGNRSTEFVFPLLEL